MSEHTCARCSVVARNAPPAPFPWPRGWAPEPNWRTAEPDPASRLRALAREGELLCLGCRRELALAPPTGRTNRARDLQRAARAACREAHPDWTPDQEAAYLGLPAPKPPPPLKPAPEPEPAPRPPSGTERAAALFRAEPSLTTRAVAARLGVTVAVARRGRRFANGGRQ